MIQQVKKSKFKKTLAIYLAMMILLESIQPLQMYALTSGPTQPEFNSFTPIGTSDMIDLASGDFNYNIPIMDVGGYPINLAYNSGVTMDQEASWVGLGWNLNVGQINRQVRGLPDDFNGDPMRYENDLRKNVTAGVNFKANPAFFGKDFPFSLGLGAQYNNYEGVTFKPSVGVSFALSENLQGSSLNFDFSSSTADGATISPSVSISSNVKDINDKTIGLTTGIGTTLSSRKGLENMSMSVTSMGKNKDVKSGTLSGSLSFNMTHNHTPTKRIGFINDNYTFNAALGTEILGGEAQGNILGYGSIQTINPIYKDRTIGGYGYDFTHHKGTKEGVLDYNREKEQPISQNTTVLPVTNYTYDIYNVEGQGISGMFRPYRSQVSYVYNDDVTDVGAGLSGGAEFGGGNLVHMGLNFNLSNSLAKTGKWKSNNFALPVFEESKLDKNNIEYQAVSYKMIGELNVDNESGLYENRLHSNKAVDIKLGGKGYNMFAKSSYRVKASNKEYVESPFSSRLKRDGRIPRNQVVQKVSQKEADDKFIFKNKFGKQHHTAGMKVIQTDGSTYVYGKTAYNTTKVEATFDVSSRTDGNIQNGLVSYNGSVKGNGTGSSDHYVNKITTPSYAHTYLISSILSPDYQDIDFNGPSDNDFGKYTKFEYSHADDKNYIANYRWRVPYQKNTASYNEGLKSGKHDQKASYLYGEKELVYLKAIETKTHIAFIDLEDRLDAMGVDSESGGMGSQSMKRIKSIRLYSKSELQKDRNGKIIDPVLSSIITPIKIAHFEYNYNLCAGIPSNLPTDANNKRGKLTLEKVYFTYRNSNMGKYTPYVFGYGESTASNPNYHIKGFDIWGNYKDSNKNGIPNAEFPFVEQNKADADINTGAWTLKTIDLPSGGKIEVSTESDDYAYVQNKKAMQMFKVIGSGPDVNVRDSNLLYDFGINQNRYIYVKVDPLDKNITKEEFIKKYLSENIDKPIYFRFLLNMTTDKSDYVSGYFEIKKDLDIRVDVNGIASIPLKFVNLDGGLVINNRQVNPISKTGWGFGRTYLNRLIYSSGGDEVNKKVFAIVRDLVSSIGAMKELVTGPNARLLEKKCAQRFDPTKSWIRLENPNGKKLGGGLRVKKITLSDEWNVMNSVETNETYKEKYGQEYNYSDSNGTSSSGVATFEPNASNENPFVEPFYAKTGNYAEILSAPKELNYVEKPFGESFFPSPKVTYSRVTVTNLNKNENGKSLKKHGTGKTVTSFYTSKDFPTKVDFTDRQLTPTHSQSNLLLSMMFEFSRLHVTASQGFVIETNDMNGKLKSEEVYPEGIDSKPISMVEYKYNVDSNNKLTNELPTINSKGEVQKQLIGVDYDMVNDFNESTSSSTSFGFDGNLASFLIGIFPGFVPLLLPRGSYHDTQLRTAVTTKVIHKTGILIEKVAHDLGSRVSTKNLAWDSQSGQVLLTETINEFDDKYYSFNYPAYWYYNNMGMASENLDLEGTLINYSGQPNLFTLKDMPTSEDISKYLKIGDELIYDPNGLGHEYTKLWVYGYNSDKKAVKLISGNSSQEINTTHAFDIKVVRSGNRNQQMANMASVTSMINPIDPSNNGILVNNITNATFNYQGSVDNRKVINASAIEYNDDWQSQCEMGLPNENGLINGEGVAVNPFIYNLKGNWRPIKSYAYLSGRNNDVTTHRRKTGFFTNFNSFYSINNKKWGIDPAGWTFASQVTKYNPYGVELENKDALNRYSSAQYGNKYTLPVAVASNSQYREIGFDGFEDYDNEVNVFYLKPHFGFSQGLIDNQVFVTTKKSHTGNKSLGVKSGTKATFIRKVEGCKPVPSTTAL
ncbi:hypothetical protein [Flavobacterium gawalongense]|uniref:Uncharacterized protein n=1 Tax=Flavobacterium gawalongense TaxID=2594432 RepID=A0A553BN45_9FLAO|nr:hypothetical protein [Flavobacterium gawalongense]TRX00136.1 hypothetical protein FNW33_13080 [Flavobacterium gawalongense]TRX04884.1 hypothetical protein FNW12_12555 [Flavobacterium gawalongense]TRX09662.1 hypothetical protein FNW11_09160 [Flavobacterium gawalongense]TRX10854.1 hypothetical protein FNW10_08860 [Flavobacterium gawalongense]TRX28067.1 hypothetical protein FNW38_08630 [Flavobacterium gawalongense]